MCDLLWADPVEDAQECVYLPRSAALHTRVHSRTHALADGHVWVWVWLIDRYLEREWGPNTVRGCSFVYGFKAVEPFLQRNRCATLSAPP